MIGNLGGMGVIRLLSFAVTDGLPLPPLSGSANRSVDRSASPDSLWKWCPSYYRLP